MTRSVAKQTPPVQAVPRAQYAALPYREENGLKVLLITSRETKRWVIPKGWPIANRTPWDSAAREALQEAGVEGEIATQALGSYDYDKKLADGAQVPVSVEVFALKVLNQRTQWREMDERQSQWFTPDEAAAAVQEPGLKAILTGFAALLAGQGKA